MGVLSSLSRLIAPIAVSRIRHWSRNAREKQEKIFHSLIHTAAETAFGRDHHFSSIRNHADFVNQVPVRDYEQLKAYIDRVAQGENDVLWPGKPLYLSKTSGTTSGVKYIPITQHSLPNHTSSTRNALFCYIAEKKDARFLDGKLIFISGSPALSEQHGVKVGRLSGIVNHHVPDYLKRNQLPSWKTNCIEDFETKVDHIVNETVDQNMTMISGIPPWVQMYFDKLAHRSGKKTGELFPHFNLFVYGGVNFEPYRKKLEDSIGRRVDSIELYPASEGFIAFQDSQYKNDLLLNVNSGIFFEFIPVSEYFNEPPTRLPLHKVETGVNYAIVLSTNAGLWGYSLGDTVKFTSVNPYRILVTGRVKHFISAFGEHVIAEEVEKALLETCSRHHAHVVEFTVAPQVNPLEGELPHHEWFIEFDQLPHNMKLFSEDLDKIMQQLNIYYRDLIQGHVLRPLKINCLKKDGFIDYMRAQGKLGGQNKVPRLSNDRKMANELMTFVS
jgi:phenylacetate-coenzyme A ligase PaaK-like adenylate-forming protein